MITTLVIIIAIVALIALNLEKIKGKLTRQKKIIDVKNKLNEVQIISDRKFCIFLDFQGVLFVNSSDNYKYIPNLCKVLDKFPNAGIVVSSTYKDMMPFTSIQNLFPEKYQTQVLGVTPNLNTTRNIEIEKYVSDNNVTDFIAIDDNPSGTLFPKDCDYLFETDSNRALDDETVEKFIEFIKL